VRRLVAAAIAAGVLLALMPGGQAAARGPCVPHGAKVIVKEASTVTVYSVRTRKRRAGVGRAYYACSALSGARTALGFVANEPCLDLEKVGPFAVASPYLAYGQAYTSCEGDDSYALLFLLDLRGGKPVPLGSAGTREDFGKVAGVTALAARSDGSVAWIANTFATQPGLHEVWLDDAAGRRMADQGTDVAKASLGVSDTTATWTKAGQAVSAPLGMGPAVGSGG
jgi:hypothetical protein